uniref:Uncharacterized protein n=1 Tax=Tanacetum cinerariifolium TaxID=118510 RepID=A0A699HDZ7_TANCI|nr:hypothetical protein [Tanacetum cinerariifolium]
MSSSLGERNHEMIYEEVYVGDSNRLGGEDKPIEASEEHSIGKYHQVAFDHTFHFLGHVVTDIAQKDKNKAKPTKLSTRMERVQEIKAEGDFISYPILLILLILQPKRSPKTITPIFIGGWDMKANQRSRSIAWRTNKIGGLGLEMGGSSKRL